MKECTSLGVLGTGQSLTLETFSGLGDTPWAERTCPKNITLVWKKYDFLGLILRCIPLTKKTLIKYDPAFGPPILRIGRCHQGKTAR